jgi:hypothetical protein
VSQWLTIDIRCETCGLVSDMLIDRSEKDDSWQCPDCPEGTSMKRVFLTAPAVMNAALPDGVRRKGFRELAEAARLEVESYNLAPEKRGHINREITKLKEVK